MGGNVFDGSSPIKKENIKPTLKEFFKELKEVFPNSSEALHSIVLVGSAGKVEESGDIDLALDKKYITDLKYWGIKRGTVIYIYSDLTEKYTRQNRKFLMRKATVMAIAQKLDDESRMIKVDDRSTSSGAIFCQFPQYDTEGRKLDKKVQIDLNIGDIDWLTWAYRSKPSKDPVIKGLHRTQLLHALFAEKNYSMNNGLGVKEKDTSDYVAKTPDEAVSLLNKLYSFDITKDDTMSFEKLNDFLEDHLDKDEYDKVIDRYLQILDNMKCDIPVIFQNRWLDSQERLELTGDHLPSSSKLFPFRLTD